MSFYDDTEDEPRSILPGYLTEALDRCFPAPEHSTSVYRSSPEALEVLARVLPHVDDTDDVISTVFPYDGPHSPDNVRAAARAFTAIGRYLNNATQPGKSTLEWGSTIGAILGNVKAALYQLDQLLEQLADGALRLAEDPTLYSDQVDYERGSPREQWDTLRHDAGVRTAMTIADQLYQLRAELVTWNDTGMRPVGGIAVKLEEPHSLASQLGHDSPDTSEA